MGILRDAVDELANSEGRSASHVALGAAVCAFAVLGSAAVASRYARHEKNPERQEFKKAAKLGDKPVPKPLFSAVWPPLFLTLTLSGLRIWNAAPGRERDRALTLWACLQGMNALLTAWAPEKKIVSLAANFAILGAVRAYASSLKEVDEQTASLVSPFASTISFAHLVADAVSDLSGKHGDTVPDPATAH